MGLFSRASKASSSSFWKMAQGVMGNGEEQVDYAHLVATTGDGERPGTLFLTSRQLIWRIADPRLPRGSGFEVPISDVLVAGPTEDTKHIPGAFGVGLILNGERGMVAFRPQRADDTSVSLAERLMQSIRMAYAAARSQGAN